jgi:hypothetical protein
MIMKNIIFFLLITFMPVSLYAKNDSEKTINLQAHIEKILLVNDSYEVEFLEYAAVYKAGEQFLTCLQKSMRENKKAAIKVNSLTLKIVQCDAN